MTTFIVDEENIETEKPYLAASEILELAGCGSKPYYLVEIKDGNEQVSYRSKPHKVILITDKLRFVSVYVGPMTSQ